MKRQTYYLYSTDAHRISVDRKTWQRFKTANIIISNGYPHIRKYRTSLHRLVTGAKKGQIVDHINGMRTDCRICNLRITTQSINVRNRPARSGTIIGIKPARNSTAFTANISIDKQRIYLGSFSSLDDARTAYDIAVCAADPHAPLNFPKRRKAYLSGRIENPPKLKWAWNKASAEKKSYKWSSAAIALLGTAPDDFIARCLNTSRSTVYRKRIEIGVSPRGKCFLLTPEHFAKLGTRPDHVLAKAWKLNRATVTRFRNERLIPSYKSNL